MFDIEMRNEIDVLVLNDIKSDKTGILASD